MDFCIIVDKTTAQSLPFCYRTLPRRSTSCVELHGTAHAIKLIFIVKNMLNKLLSEIASFCRSITRRCKNVIRLELLGILAVVSFMKLPQKVADHVLVELL